MYTSLKLSLEGGRIMSRIATICAARTPQLESQSPYRAFLYTNLENPPLRPTQGTHVRNSHPTTTTPSYTYHVHVDSSLILSMCD